MYSNIFFINFYYTYIKISKDSSAKYYESNKEKLQHEAIRKKSKNMVVNNTKSYQKMKSKSLLSMKKIL